MRLATIQLSLFTIDFIYNPRFPLNLEAKANLQNFMILPGHSIFTVAKSRFNFLFHHLKNS